MEPVWNLNLLLLETHSPAISPAEPRSVSSPTTVDSHAQKAVPDAPEGWPKPLEGNATNGLAGDIVRAIAPHTEADPAAILFQFLVAFGNVVGRQPHFKVEATEHHLNLFLSVVGETAKARKGTSWGHVDRVFRLLSESTPSGSTKFDWAERLITGLGSGEGLIWAAKDDAVSQTTNDKRLVVIDGEFASTLTILNREGNTLSPVLRNAWDSGHLKIVTKNNPVSASGAHISIIAHITRDELKRELTATEMANGFANRFLWTCSRRSKLLPDGGSLKDSDLAPLIERLKDAVGYAQTVQEIKRDDDARTLWHQEYERLSDAKSGLLGAVTARAEAQVVRLAAIYALLEQSSVVKKDHLQAALAAWDYCDESAAFIFGQSLGDPVADRILSALRQTATGLTRTEIRDLFQRNQSKARIEEAFDILTHRRLVEKRYKSSGKQEVEVWFAR